MGCYFAVGRCICCGRHFAFHPERVPSLRVEGRREPICKTCVETINPVRKASGLAEIVPLPGAYEPGSEEEDLANIEEGE
jgi:hypothetical protein